MKNNLFKGITFFITGIKGVILNKIIFFIKSSIFYIKHLFL